MPDKGKIMSQTLYERQSRLINLYKELFIRKEINANEAIMALRMIGFSKTIAAIRVREWADGITTIEPLTEKEKKQNQKERASLEKYVLQMLLGKKYYLRLRFKRKELTKDETVIKLVKSGCKEEIARELVNEWESQR